VTFVYHLAGRTWGIAGKAWFKPGQPLLNSILKLLILVGSVLKRESLSAVKACFGRIDHVHEGVKVDSLVELEHIVILAVLYKIDERFTL
jgi:hypothetical protein